MWCLYAHAAPAHEQRPVERGGKPTSRRKEAESSSADWRMLETRGGLLLKTPLGIYATEPVVATIHGVHAGRYSRKRRRVAEEATNARQWVPGPEKRLSAEAKAFRNPPQGTATPQVARSEEWSIRRFKTSKRPNR